MKKLLLVALALLPLGGCLYVPVWHDHHHRYDYDRGYGG